jgi:hypothetical protein
MTLVLKLCGVRVKRRKEAVAMDVDVEMHGVLHADAGDRVEGHYGLVRATSSAASTAATFSTASSSM